MRKLLVCLLLAVLPLCANAQQPPKPGKVVFVCQHGAALSVIAASYFNKLAAEAHLNVHTIARGVTPQENLSVSATQGLKADGMTWELEKPLPLTPADARGALRIVIFYPIAAEYAKLAPVESWEDVPPMTQAYPVVRDAILKRLPALVKQLKAQQDAQQK